MMFKRMTHRCDKVVLEGFALARFRGVSAETNEKG